MKTGSLVHVIDDDEAVRDSLSFVLRTAELEVRTYDSAGAFLAELPNSDVGCLITDVRMPEMSGVDLLHRLKELGSNLPVIVITGHGDVQLAVEAMKLGARDFIEKPFDDEVVLKAIKSALDEGYERAQRDAERAELLQRLSTLSSRERDVLNGLAAGKLNKVIAFDLGISPRTIEIYRAHVMTKMNATSLSDLIRMAVITGVLKSSKSSVS